MDLFTQDDKRGVAAAPSIVTSCWYTKLPGVGNLSATETHMKLGISRGTPRRQPAGYRQFKVLAPGAWFNSVGPDEYRKRYFAEVLDTLDPAQIVTRIRELAAGRTAVLVCYEKPDDDEFCHRAYVSAWLKDKLELDVPELGREGDGIAWAHPKLPPQHRTRMAA